MNLNKKNNCCSYNLRIYKEKRSMKFNKMNKKTKNLYNNQKIYKNNKKICCKINSKQRKN